MLKHHAASHSLHITDPISNTRLKTTGLLDPRTLSDFSQGRVPEALGLLQYWLNLGSG